MTRLASDTRAMALEAHRRFGIPMSVILSAQVRAARHVAWRFLVAMLSLVFLLGTAVSSASAQAAIRSC